MQKEARREDGRLSWIDFPISKLNATTDHNNFKQTA